MTVHPSRDDPAVAAASEWIGGPIGDHWSSSGRWWTPLRVALAVVCAVMALGFLADKPCYDDGWETRDDRAMWTAMCYSDVPFLYRERGFAAGALAYREAALEYPVLSGAVMQASAEIVNAVQGDEGDAVAGGVGFYVITTVLMAAMAVIVIVAMAWTVPRRPWDPLLAAAAPILLLSGTINWDLLAVALASLAILAWSREHPLIAGALIGLGVSAKLYPALLLGAILLVALRDPDRRKAVGRWSTTTTAAVVAWLAVNVPVAAWAPAGWREFFTFNSDRQADFGSVWYALGLLDPGLLPSNLNLVVVVVAAVLILLIAAVTLGAEEPPRLSQVAFLAVAAFLLVNKVWSPQYALWLLPLAVLARPRWRDLLIWQAIEVMYFVGVWRYLADLFSGSEASNTPYAWMILIRAAAVVWFCGMVVRDMLRPERDPVRRTMTLSANTGRARGVTV